MLILTLADGTLHHANFRLQTLEVAAGFPQPKTDQSWFRSRESELSLGAIWRRHFHLSG
jgi:hypothetical protein